jgi:hypothetical protein
VLILPIVAATASPVTDFLTNAAEIIGGASVIGTAVGTIGGALWKAAGERVLWADCIGVATGLGAVFGFALLLVLAVSGNLS